MMNLKPAGPVQPLDPQRPDIAAAARALGPAMQQLPGPPGPGAVPVEMLGLELKGGAAAPLEVHALGSSGSPFKYKFGATDQGGSDVHGVHLDPKNMLPNINTKGVPRRRPPIPPGLWRNGWYGPLVRVKVVQVGDPRLA